MLDPDLRTHKNNSLHAWQKTPKSPFKYIENWKYLKISFGRKSGPFSDVQAPPRLFLLLSNISTSERISAQGGAYSRTSKRIFGLVSTTATVYEILKRR